MFIKVLFVWNSSFRWRIVINCCSVSLWGVHIKLNHYWFVEILIFQPRQLACRGNYWDNLLMYWLTCVTIGQRKGLIRCLTSCDCWLTLCLYLHLTSFRFFFTLVVPSASSKTFCWPLQFRLWQHYRCIISSSPSRHSFVYLHILSKVKISLNFYVFK